MNTLFVKVIHQGLVDIGNTMLCHNISDDNYLTQFAFLLISFCSDEVYDSTMENLPFLILGSSPYSEPMNHILNILWGHLDISLKDLKLLIEILKISTVLGCASNFIIYIIMSKKLRENMAKKLRYWQ